MAELLGRTADAAEYRSLADRIRAAFHDAFYNRALGRYTAQGDAGPAGATQAAQALALDEGLVPESERAFVLDALVELVRAHRPTGGGPHLGGGTIGLAPIVRSLHAAGRDDVLWDVLQEDTRPSYGYFLQPTTAHPGGLTTLPETWDLRYSNNHMILLQIEEWFHTGLAGIRRARGDVAYRRLVIDPRPVGDLTSAEGSYRTPYGVVSSRWTLREGEFRLRVSVPPNTTAEVWVPGSVRDVPAGARFDRLERGRSVYAVGSGSYAFAARGVPLTR